MDLFRAIGILVGGIRTFVGANCTRLGAIGTLVGATRTLVGAIAMLVGANCTPVGAIRTFVGATRTLVGAIGTLVGATRTLVGAIGSLVGAWRVSNSAEAVSAREGKSSTPLARRPKKLGPLSRSSWHPVCELGSMASDYTQLTVWQLAAELRVQTLKLTRKPSFVSELRLRSETEAAVSSVCRNIPEGFRRRSNREFARFLEYSYGSLGELKSLFEDAQLKELITSDDLAPLSRLRYRLERALLALMRHLRASRH